MREGVTGHSAPLKIKLQIMCGQEIAMGPGKAALLEAIKKEGSISAAGRALGMSYRRTWLLVDAMNRCWASPLVEAVAGGGRDRGARVTETGREVLNYYRSLERRASGAIAEDRSVWLADHLRREPLPPGT